MTDAGLRRLADWLHQRQMRVRAFAEETQPREPTDPRLARDGMRLRGIPAVGPLSHGSAIPGTRPDVEVVRRWGRWQGRRG